MHQAKDKEKINNYDKAGVIYHHKCNQCEASYVGGETGRVWRERLHDHRILDHHQAKISHTIAQGNTIPEPEPTEARRSTRLKTKDKIDYKKMNQGGEQYTTEGETPVAYHVTKICPKEEMTSQIRSTELNWNRRGIKEALAIQELDPTLNRDNGRYHLPSIYSIIPKLAKRTHRNENPNPSTGDYSRIAPAQNPQQDTSQQL